MRVIHVSVRVAPVRGTLGQGLLLLIGASYCANHYPAISIYYTEVHLSSCQHSACWVCSCFCNPPKSDMDYRLFNVYTWSFLCVHIYTHRGWTHRQRVGTTFLTQKTHKFFLCSWRDLNLVPLDLQSDALPIELPCHPIQVLHLFIQSLSVIMNWWR